jgi:hypothetical protein
MSLFSGLWGKLRKLFSRSSQKPAASKKSPAMETAKDAQLLNKDLAELAAALNQPKTKAAIKKAPAAPPVAEVEESESRKFARELLDEVVTAEPAAPQAQKPEAQPAVTSKAEEVAPVVEKVEPVKETPSPAARKETSAAAETAKPQASAPAAKTKPAEVVKTQAAAESPVRKPEATPAPKQEEKKVAAPLVAAKPNRPVTASSPAKPKGKAVTVKAPRVPVVDNRLKPTSTSDPQRLARLLVSEIKLYNEKKVSEGLQNNNLYDLLKKPIDQSLEHYRASVGNNAEQTVNYFHEELVKTLCDGDPAKLGPNFPQS